MSDTAWAQRFVQRHLVSATVADARKLLDVVILLAQTPSGLENLDALTRWDIGIEFDMRSGGAAFRASGKRIILNRTHTAARTATDLVHEATHAIKNATKSGADLQHDSREQYIANILAEETDCYFREAIVGRELLHIGRERRWAEWAQLTTSHTLQIWFQLVHGVPYRRTLKEDAIRADGALSSSDVESLISGVKPYFYQYVQAYRDVEGAKWDMAHGLRKFVEPDIVAEALAARFDQQSPLWTNPLRGSPLEIIMPPPPSRSPMNRTASRTTPPKQRQQDGFVIAPKRNPYV